MRGSYHYPHLCVGFLFLVLYPVIRFLLLLVLLLLRASLCHSHTTFHTRIFHTLDKNWIIVVIRWELNPMTCNSTRERDIYIYMGYGGHQLRLKCAQVHHQSPAGTFARVPGMCLHWSPTPPGPRYNASRRRSFTSIQTVHTHIHMHTHTYTCT